MEYKDVLILVSNALAADVLAMQDTRLSAAMTFTYTVCPK